MPIAHICSMWLALDQHEMRFLIIYTPHDHCQIKRAVVVRRHQYATTNVPPLETQMCRQSPVRLPQQIGLKPQIFNRRSVGIKRDVTLVAQFVSVAPKRNTIQTTTTVDQRNFHQRLVALIQFRHSQLISAMSSNNSHKAFFDRCVNQCLEQRTWVMFFFMLRKQKKWKKLTTTHNAIYRKAVFQRVQRNDNLITIVSFDHIAHARHTKFFIALKFMRNAEQRLKINLPKRYKRTK